MGSKLLHFIKYNNAFSLALAFIFLSTGTIFAANDDLRSTIIDSSVDVVAVDNSSIRGANLNNFDAALEIIEVTEDDETFYVTYKINTYEVIDGVWVKVANEEQLEVDKEILDEGDLGVFVAQELQEVVDANIQYLKEVQEIERSVGSTQRVTQTQYSGLVGRVLDSQNATFVGYKPVIPPEKEPIAQPRPDNTVAQAGESVNNDIATVVNEEVSSESGTDDEQQPEEDEQSQTPAPTEDPVAEESASSTASTTAATSADTVAPTLTINGEAETTSELNEPFTDPGATAVDDRDGDISETITITGTVDVAAAGTYTLVYTATDAAGNFASATRTVTVVYTPPVVDETSPEITLNGADLVLLLVGDSYVEEGAVATDNIDGDLTVALTISGDVDTSTAGSYTVTYTVSDATGNTHTVERTVTVQPFPEPEPESAPVVEDTEE